jgi:hypothetical protein
MFLADWFFSSQLRKSRDGEFSVWNDIYDSKVNADIVVYGSSRAMVHMDPEIIRDSLNVNAYNLGLNGHNFWLQYFRHKELLKYNQTPKFIIHSVDIFTLVKRDDLFHLEQFLPYMLFNRDIEQWTSSYQGFTAWDYYVPLIRYYGQYKTMGRVLKSSIMGSTKADSARYLGFSAQDQQWNDDLVKARIKFPDYRVKLDSTSIQLFDQYLQECLNAGIAVVLVYSPEFVEGQDFVKNRTDIINTFHYFASKFNIPFLDYSNDSISYRRDYFYNASHLNSSGARIFTSKMIHDLKGNEAVARLIHAANEKQIHQAALKAEEAKLVFK